MPFTYVVNVYSEMSLSKGHLGSMHAQKEYSKVLEMKSTYILNILALLFFLNSQCIYSKSGLNGTQYKGVK